MEDYTRNQKRGRSRIFRSCFPAVSFDKSDHGNTKKGRLGKQVLMADVNLVNSSGADCYSNRSSHRRFVSRLFKAVLFDSLMVKKIHKSSSKSPIASDKTEPYLSIGNVSESTDEREHSSTPSNLSPSSSQTTSSSSSSTTSYSRSSSNQKTSPESYSVDFRHSISSKSSTLEKPNRLDRTVRKLNSVKIKSGGNSWNIRLCLFVFLSLVVLMVYGRIYSILCTSTWFYFLPCGRIKRVNSVSERADTESDQYKKRVIMAGLLDRARNPLR